MYTSGLTVQESQNTEQQPNSWVEMHASLCSLLTRHIQLPPSTEVSHNVCPVLVAPDKNSYNML